MCNCLNNYDNLNGWSLHSVYIFMKNVPKKSTIFLTFFFIASVLKIYHSNNIFFELENMSTCIYEILPALDLTQSVHAKISIGMHRGVKF